jgi:NAD(P)-dependent dehydrogenase (short-subunit alcohol dehydrogenase family)
MQDVVDRSRCVVVTGASAGIGLSAACQFAEAGDRVVAGVRNAERAAPVLDAAARLGVEIDVVEMDVRDDASVAAAFQLVDSRHGPVDVLVANAGTGALGTLEELSIDELREAMEVNFYGVVRAVKAVLPGMRHRRSGRVIAVTSVGGAIGQPFTDAYCAAKFATEGLLESLRPVMARFDVHISIVQPGPVATEFHAKSLGIDRGKEDGPYDELRRRHATVMTAGDSRRQPIDAAARVIVDVAGADNPRLRYQTSQFTSRLIGIKLADLDGSLVSGFTSGWLDAPSR